MRESPSKIRDRMIRVIDAYAPKRATKYSDLENMTGVAAARWNNLYNRNQMPTPELISGIAKCYPWSILWILTGKTNCKQVNPLEKESIIDWTIKLQSKYPEFKKYWKENLDEYIIHNAYAMEYYENYYGEKAEKDFEYDYFIRQQNEIDAMNLALKMNVGENEENDEFYKNLYINYRKELVRMNIENHIDFEIYTLHNYDKVMKIAYMQLQSWLKEKKTRAIPITNKSNGEILLDLFNRVKEKMEEKDIRI